MLYADTCLSPSGQTLHPLGLIDPRDWLDALPEQDQTPKRKKDFIHRPQPESKCPRRRLVVRMPGRRPYCGATLRVITPESGTTPCAYQPEDEDD